jgi:hypothetical protein
MARSTPLHKEAGDTTAVRNRVRLISKDENRKEQQPI